MQYPSTADSGILINSLVIEIVATRFPLQRLQFDFELSDCFRPKK